MSEWKTSPDTIRKLIGAALAARENAYSPYSGFCVGAALLSLSGKIVTGCNIESASYSPTVCAERVAFFKAVSEGLRGFQAIAIVGGSGAHPDALCPPCGVCRQVMSEFCSAEFEIIPAQDEDTFQIYTLNALLPMRFGPKQLQK